MYTAAGKLLYPAVYSITGLCMDCWTGWWTGLVDCQVSNYESSCMQGMACIIHYCHALASFCRTVTPSM